MQHHTGTKGDIGVAMATADLLRQGYEVLAPLSSTSSFDLVTLKDGVFTTIQVKFRTKSANGTLEVRPRRAVVSRTGKRSDRKMSPAEAQVVCVYCPDTNQCYYIRNKDLQICSLRLDPAKNNQKSCVWDAKGFTRMIIAG